VNSDNGHKGDVMAPTKKFEDALSPQQRRAFRALTTPEKIQQFLDRIRYHEEDSYHCPLTTMKTGRGCCFEGALLAAAALARLGHLPLIVTLVARDDDDHVLAIYKKNKRWGALAKSLYPGLRSRQPVYRTLRELVMSYFEFYFNSKAQRTLREYSMPLDLTKFDAESWMKKEETMPRISEALDSARHMRVVSPHRAGRLPNVDKWLFDAEMHGAARAKHYR
jgi:hypothetical protein